jgi:uncharacterized protein YbjT (DUF2867 family)
MFVITGITGNVGGEVARNLLAAGTATSVPLPSFPFTFTALRTS